MHSDGRGWMRAMGVGAAGLVLLPVSGCADPDPNQLPTPEVAFEALPPGNPFEVMPLYVYPGTWAARAAADLRAQAAPQAELAEKIARQPAAEWFSYPLSEIRDEVDRYVSAAANAGALPLLAPYNVPNRDCGQYSAGGVGSADGYRDWVDAFVDGIGQRPAVVVVEPDALPLLDQCLAEPEQAERLELIRYFVDSLAELPSAVAYLDAGHSSWVASDAMAERLLAAGIAQARGFALNISNYQRDDDLVRYGRELVERLGLDSHFVIDSSRNGNGPATGPENWCNPEGRALGQPPTAASEDSVLDAYLWVKRPGESDGECRGGPAPGLWFPERAYELAGGATW